MSSGELLVILIVALLVFGPEKLHMLARHAGRFYRQVQKTKLQLSQFWHAQQLEQQLLENERRAQEAADHASSNSPPETKHTACHPEPREGSS